MDGYLVFDVNSYAFLLLGMLYFILQREMDEYALQVRMFSRILLTAMLLLLTDYLSTRGAGYLPPVMMQLAMFVTFALCTLITWPIFLWVRSQIKEKPGGLQYWTWLPVLIYILDMLLLLSSFRTGWYFYFPEDGGYHHGVLFWLHMLLPFLVLLEIEGLVVYWRNHLNRENLYSLLFFPVPVLLALLGALYTADLSFVPAGIAFSLIAVFITVQSHISGHDFITNAYNRHRLELHIQRRIRETLPGMMFAVLLIDLENFPAIHMQWGRARSNEALQELFTLLRKAVRRDDFIARYAGHEFCIVLNDIQGSEEIMNVTLDIQQRIDIFNEGSDPDRPYPLQCHLIYDLYAPEMKMAATDFLQRIDDHLCHEKQQLVQQSRNN